MILHYYSKCKSLNLYQNRNENSKFSLVMIFNGNLAGLTAVTESCDGNERGLLSLLEF